MKNSPINKFQRIIEDTNWDNELLSQEDRMNGACWLLIVIAVLFFALVIGQILIR